jgi:hypothetical protein
MRLLGATFAAFGLLAFTFTAAFADRAPKTEPAAEKLICRDVQRYSSRIKERVCGSPEQLARYEHERHALAVLMGDRVFPPNGDARSSTTTFE